MIFFTIFDGGGGRVEDGGKIKTIVFQLLSPDLYNLLLRSFPHLVAGVCVSVAPALNAPGERPPVLLVVVTGLAQLAELALVTGGAVAPGVKGNNSLLHTHKLHCVVKSTFGEPQTQSGDMRPLLLLLSLAITYVRESRVGAVACPNKSTAAAAAETTTTTTTMPRLSEDASTIGCDFDAGSSFHH